MGHYIAQIHAIDTDKYLKEDSQLGSTNKESWKAFLSLNHDRALETNAKYCGLPKRYHKELYEYLPKKENLLKDLKLDGERKICFLHADLCDENVLLLEKSEYVKDNSIQKITFAINQFNSINFFPTAIIDFGDSRIGDPIYDFVAIHLSVFRCDKYLFRIFLYYYNKTIFDLNIPFNLPSVEEFSYIAMCYTLLNESPALKSAISYKEEVANAKDFKDMEKILWDFNDL